MSHQAVGARTQWVSLGSTPRVWRRSRAGARTRARIPMASSSYRKTSSSESSESESSARAVGGADAAKTTRGGAGAGAWTRVSTFGGGTSGDDRPTTIKRDKESLGGKGYNLSEMSRVGLSVPPGFTVTTETCEAYHELGGALPEDAWEEILLGVAETERAVGARFGDADAPLLVSVRSGAAVSMPGMMDTVLNLGMNDATCAGLAKRAGGRFAYDSYRRFLDMYGDVVLGVPHEAFETELENLKTEMNVESDEKLTEENLRELVERYKAVYERHNTAFPQDPYEQLRAACSAVFDSWQSDRAKKYMAINKIVGLRGTAVNVQAMVFGNMGDTSGTGVLFTRDPSTGENKLYGEYLVNAQGEDVVAGIRTPSDISTMAQALPEAYEELVRNTQLLEKHYKDMQDIEFTVQEGKLYMLQCRSGKRTGAGAVKIAVDMVDEGLVTEEEAVLMVEPTHIDQLLHPQFEDESAYKADVIGKGLPASPGAAVGTIVFTTEEAEKAKKEGRKVILVRTETSPEDVGGMDAAEGILTARGGMTSHAAVVARGWGKTCVSGCGELVIDEHAKTAKLGGVTLTENDWLSLNGTTGEIIRGRAELAPPTTSDDLQRFMAWVDEFREVKVLTNADTPEDSAMAREYGAQGIGLVRTEHMFFGSGERLRAVRRMIIADDTKSREAALEALLPFQRDDFKGIFKAMSGLPVTIRLLDPPLHEFLPEGDLDDVVKLLAEDVGETEAEIHHRIERLAEVNPMLGFRGCRLAICYPEIARMQVRAIFEAACEAKAEGASPVPEIMIPLVGAVAEFEQQARLVRGLAAQVFAERGDRVDFRVGTMIEIPRAALLSAEIAKHAEFFSFGTNDLTQMTFGYSRDDAGKFLPTYLERGVLERDPFQTIDRDGVGQLVAMSVERGRSTNPQLKVGICGEHGGDPSSVEFFHQTGLDYVSCSPFRVPIARLAAAQSAIRERRRVRDETRPR